MVKIFLVVYISYAQNALFLQDFGCDFSKIFQMAIYASNDLYINFKLIILKQDKILL